MTLPAFEHPEWLLPLSAVLVGCALALCAAALRARRHMRVLLGALAVGHWRSAALLDAQRLVAVGSIAMALLGPLLAEEWVSVEAAGVDLVLLLDTSQSMDARDVAPSRLARAKRAAAGVLGGLGPGDRVALAAYAGRGVRLTPLSSDPPALAELIAGLDTRLIRPGGSDLREGIAHALTAFEAGAERRRVIFVVGDGELSTRGGDFGQEAAVRAGVRVYAAALGSDAGASVPDRGAPLLDARGGQVISRRRLDAFSALTQATGGKLFVGDAWGEIDLNSANAAIHTGLQEHSQDRVLEPRITALVWPFAAAAFVLLGFSLLPRVRLRSGLAAAGLALICLPLLGGGSVGVAGLDASARGEDLTAEGMLDLGLERALQGDWAGAKGRFFAAATATRNPDLAGLAYHNLAVAYLEMGELTHARDFFFQSLTSRPGHLETQFDLEWTLRLIAQEGSGAEGAQESPQPGESDAEDRAVKPESPESSRLDERSRTGENAASGAPSQGESGGQAAPNSGTAAGRAGERSAAEPGDIAGAALPMSSGERERWLARVHDDVAVALRLATQARPAAVDVGSPAHSRRDRKARELPSW